MKIITKLINTSVQEIIHNQSISDLSQNAIRDKQYTDILVNYTKNQQRLHWVRLLMKIIFFMLISLSLTGIILSGCIITIHIIKTDTPNTTADLATIIAAMAGIISAIIILPKIVAKHLFPENEKDSQITVIKAMQKFDTGKDTGRIIEINQEVPVETAIDNT